MTTIKLNVLLTSFYKTFTALFLFLKRILNSTLRFFFNIYLELQYWNMCILHVLVLTAGLSDLTLKTLLLMFAETSQGILCKRLELTVHSKMQSKK